MNHRATGNPGGAFAALPRHDRRRLRHPRPGRRIARYHDQCADGGTAGAMKLLDWFPTLRGLPAPVIGIGVRPEHIRTEEAKPV